MSLDGALVIDKPEGMGSTDVVRLVRRAAGQRRVGHAGTLDPLATGVLVVCLGRATRLVRFIQAGTKTYATRMRLGVTTTTQDVTGEVLQERSAADVDEEALCAVLRAHVGEVEQVPPMVSAVKIGGERLYHKARRGEEVDRPARRVTVHDLVLEDFRPGERAEASFLVTCSSGTYVRTLVHDTGHALGCGATMTGLRRLASGALTVEDAVTVDEVRERGEAGTLEDILLSPLEVLRGLPTLEATPEEAAAVAHGRPIPARGVDGPFALATGGELLAVCRDRGGVSRPEVVLAASVGAQEDT